MSSILTSPGRLSKSRPPIKVNTSGRSNSPSGIVYSIGTLVQDRTQYDEMRITFQNGGFGSRDCEFLFIDNTEFNHMDAYKGLNAILNAAKGDYVILCHQDVRLISDDRSV